MIENVILPSKHMIMCSSFAFPKSDKTLKVQHMGPEEKRSKLSSVPEWSKCFQYMYSDTTTAGSYLQEKLAPLMKSHFYSSQLFSHPDFDVWPSHACTNVKEILGITEAFPLYCSHTEPMWVWKTSYILFEFLVLPLFAFFIVCVSVKSLHTNTESRWQTFAALTPTVSDRASPLLSFWGTAGLYHDILNNNPQSISRKNIGLNGSLLIYQHNVKFNHSHHWGHRLIHLSLQGLQQTPHYSAAQEISIHCNHSNTWSTLASSFKVLTSQEEFVLAGL